MEQIFALSDRASVLRDGAYYTSDKTHRVGARRLSHKAVWKFYSQL
jgi:hypothetical protein